MYLSQSPLSHLRISLLCFAIVAIGACTPSSQTFSSSTDTNSVAESPADPAINSESQPIDAAPPAADPASSADNSTAEQKFMAILGTQQDGWLPKVLAGKGLKQGLTPAETGKIIPGAEQVSDYGFSKVAVNDIPGLKQYEFYYAENNNGEPTKLQAVKLLFDPALNQAYPDLVKVLASKYGETKPEDVEAQMIVWVGTGFVTAQLTKQVTDFGGYELSVSLEE